MQTSPDLCLRKEAFLPSLLTPAHRQIQQEVIHGMNLTEELHSRRILGPGNRAATIPALVHQLLHKD